MATLDYIMVTGIAFPAAAILFYMYWDMVTIFYHFASITVCWPF